MSLVVKLPVMPLLTDAEHRKIAEEMVSLQRCWYGPSDPEILKEFLRLANEDTDAPKQETWRDRKPLL